MNNYRVLFFGRENDAYSMELYNYIKIYFPAVISHWVGISGSKFNQIEKSAVWDYIFCFRSRYILKKPLLDKVQIAAINFHPGPPEYRGSGCVNWALFDEVGSYGATAHLIAEEIDCGKILDVRRFKIKQDENLSSVLEKTYKTSLKQAMHIIKVLSDDGEKSLHNFLGMNKEISWEGPVRAMAELDKLYQIPTNINKIQLQKRIRATTIASWKPYFIKHGYKFELKTD